MEENGNRSTISMKSVMNDLGISEEKSIIYDGMIRGEKKKRFRFRLEPEALLYRYNIIGTI